MNPQMNTNTRKLLDEFKREGVDDEALAARCSARACRRFTAAKTQFH